MKKIIIAHAGKQHSFELAEALIKNKYKVQYITTVYDRKKSLTHFFKNILGKNNKKRANQRYSEIMKDDVIQFYEILGLVSLILLRIDKKRLLYPKFNRFLYKKFSKKVAKFALHYKPDVLIMYDGQASTCFEILSKNNSKITRVLDMSSLSLPYMKNIYEKDMKINPLYKRDLLKFSDYIFNDKNQKDAVKEINLADSIFVPSEICRKSILYVNKKSKIFIIPYGFKNTPTDSTYKFKPNSTTLNFIYTGSVNQRKGISYLFESVNQIKRKFPERDFRLTIIGKYDKNNEIISKYFNDFTFRGFLLKEKVIEELKEADLMIFPSLSDSFSFSVLEALSIGVPVICSDNTGASDIIEDGKNGFVFRTQNIEDLVRKIELAISSEKHLKEMGRQAKKSVEIYTWDNYSNKIGEVLKEIV
ncbi:glycosyltransferase family 4 protein [Enterococcus gallinarum]|uniref:glycosyltransferase family 4 protein n=1 Tax=Enterococcus gallinarum TaxID=1353 RepID=UPI001D176B03|nr:glycosyltransferase family 4 protein [Enterococcus gallinarum]MCC4044173.1 glycosyltransferase family 4 protein [Enterococcus gallinarum]